MKPLVLIALALSLGALAAPAYAGQLTPVQRIIRQEQARKNDPSLFGPAAISAGTTLSPIQRIIAQEKATRRPPPIFVRGTAPATTAIQVVDASSFHWGDAGIGAAAALGLLVLAAGVFLVLRYDRSRSA
jgi:hypothetical protein